MPKLHQLLAVVAGKKNQTHGVVTGIYHYLQQSTLFEGITRTYTPKDEEGDKLPSETKRIQARAQELFRKVAIQWEDLWDCIASVDASNQIAKANIVIDDLVLATDVPITTLLFLEKGLKDVRALIGKMPTLDPAYNWTWDASTSCFRADAVSTVRTQKVPRNHVKYEATKEHPAQVEMFTEDVIVGKWEKIDSSGAISESTKDEMLARVGLLIEAVLSARESANNIDAKHVEIGSAIFDYITNIPSLR